MKTNKKVIAWLALWSLLTMSYSNVLASLDTKEVKNTEVSVTATVADVMPTEKMSIMPYYPTEELDKDVDSVYKNNRFEEDYVYNQANLFTKKVNVFASVKPEDLKNMKKLYVVFSQVQYWYPVLYKEGDVASDGGAVLNTEKVNEHLVRYDLKNKEIPKEIVLNLNDLTDKLWANGIYATPILYAEMNDGSEKRLSATMQGGLYLSPLTNDNKLNFFVNLGSTEWKIQYYYAEYGRDSIFKDEFNKLKEKHKTKYNDILLKLQAKLNKMIEDEKMNKTNLLNFVSDEKSVNTTKEKIYKSVNRENVLTYVLEEVKKELKDNELQKLKDELFADL